MREDGTYGRINFLIPTGRGLVVDAAIIEVWQAADVEGKEAARQVIPMVAVVEVVPIAVSMDVDVVVVVDVIIVMPTGDDDTAVFFVANFWDANSVGVFVTQTAVDGTFDGGASVATKRRAARSETAATMLSASAVGSAGGF